MSVIFIPTAFPSPCGDYGSYREDGLFDNVGGNFSFRPLAGIMVLIFYVFHDNSSSNKSFRPLAGIMVLI